MSSTPGSGGSRFRLLHIEADRLILLGLRGAVPPDWSVTSIHVSKGSEPPPIEGEWNACLLGVRDAAGSVRDALSLVLSLGQLDCPLLVWLPSDASQYIPAMLALGVVGFVSRAASFEELLAAIVNVVSGGTFVDPRLRAGLPRRSVPAGLDLTPMQQRVAALYVLHGNRRLVARDLHVSENTIKYHLRRIYAKTGTSSLHQLHQLLLSRGWSPQGQD